MSKDDPTLQELIVRALTGTDRHAKESLESAVAGDPALRQFCAELDDVVNLLAGCKDWRRQSPTAELTAKIREAVATKLPTAPPHFRTVFMEADLGRRSSMRKLVAVIVVLLLLIAAAIPFFLKQDQDVVRRPKLEGKAIFETTLTKDGDPLQKWSQSGTGAWEIGGGSLHAQESENPGAFYLKEGFDAGHPLAFDIQTSVPELDEHSTVSVFLADAAGATQPVFNAGARPAQALSLEIGRDGLVLSCPARPLLQSKPRENLNAHLYRLRMEYFGSSIRILVDGEVFFDGADIATPQGPLHPGVRVAGPQKNAVRFNAVRIER